MNIYNLLKGEITQQDLLNYHNATIIYKYLPEEVNGYVFYYRNIYCIVINNELSYYKKKKTILHELSHIELNQLEQRDKDLFSFYIDKYEDEANKYVKYLLNDIKNNL